MTIFLCVSVTETESKRLRDSGPRRDYAELAATTGGTIVYRTEATRSNGVWRRMAGPHVRQAFRTARRVCPGDVCFADGEHIGLPLVAFLFVMGKRRVRVVMLGHLVDRPWKKLLFRLGTRLVPRGTLVLHSVEQQRLIRPSMAPSWNVLLMPYQVDTEYWNLPRDASHDPPTLLAVGSENRDYDTLVAAVADLPVRVVIAAGSHWARSAARTASTLPHMTYVAQPLAFADLREAYRKAAAVVVPIRDVSNQSGVTVILEAMSMGCPIIVSASRGQRECVQGPLVCASGDLDADATADRGPGLFGEAGSHQTTGTYVPTGDPVALRAAIVGVLAEPEKQSQIGAAARHAAVRHFTLDSYVRNLQSVLLSSPAEGVLPDATGARA